MSDLPLTDVSALAAGAASSGSHTWIVTIAGAVITTVLGWIGRLVSNYTNRVKAMETYHAEMNARISTLEAGLSGRFVSRTELESYRREHSDQVAGLRKELAEHNATILEAITNLVPRFGGR